MTDSFHFTPLSVLRAIPSRQLYRSLLLGLLQTGLSIGWPLLIYRAIQPLPTAFDGPFFVEIAGIVVVFSLAQWLAWRQAFYNFAIIDAACLRLSDKLYHQLAGLQWLAFKQSKRAYLYDLLMSDFWRIRQGISKLLDSVLISTIIVLAMLGFIAWLSTTMVIFCLVGMGLIALLGITTKQKTRPLLVAFQAAWRRQHGWAVALLDKFELFKMGRGVADTATQHHDHTREFLSDNTRMLREQLFWKSWLNWSGNVLRVATLFLGVYLIQSGELSAQEFVLVLFLLSIIQSHIQPLSTALFSFMDAQEAAITLDRFFRLPSELKPTKSDREHESAHSCATEPLKSIVLSNVCFSYPDKPVIKNKSLSLEQGNIYLWKGENGAGKSTMARILLGHLTPSAGELCINGAPTPWPELSLWRHQTALIDQHVTLFGGTIKDNVLFGHPAAEQQWSEGDPELKRQLLPVQKDPENYQVGECGGALSGGEARRVALLRELYTDHTLLVLDEPTNHLDRTSINLLKRTITQLKDDKIIIIISHLDEFDDVADQTIKFTPC